MNNDVPQLGRIEPVDLRTIWRSEPYSFTPWLAQPENLSLLAQACGFGALEHVSTEQRVSEFSVDIVAKIPGSNDLVAIENQLERSDHLHLGQSITYAAGTDAKAIVWVAREFAEGHLAALEWLNRKTTDDVAFFGVIVSAVRIGDSAPAPQFTALVKPNDWARSVRDQAIAQDNSPENLANLAYWSAFDPLAASLGVQHGMAKLTKGSNYYHYFNSRKRNGISAYLARAGNRLGAYVFEYDKGAELFPQLEKYRQEIEAEFGSPMFWTQQKTGFWIGARLDAANVDDQSDWPRQHRWLAETMAKLKALLEPRLRALGAFDPPPSDDGDS